MMNQVDSSSFDDDKDDDKSPKNDFKIESTSSRSRLISSFMRRNQEDSRIKRSLISRFKRRWIQDSREEIKKTSQGKYWKDFSKTKHSTVLFFKRVFLKIF